jgi:tetratricopeptide (TPR) repeat protein
MAIAINPRHRHAYGNQGRAYLAVGRIQQAIQDFDAQIEIDPRHANAFGGRAQAYLMVGNAQRALADVERALELQPNGEYLLRMRGFALLVLQRQVEATKPRELVKP